MTTYGRQWAVRRERYWATHAKVCARCGSVEAVLLHQSTYRCPSGEEPDDALVPSADRATRDITICKRNAPIGSSSD